MSDEEMDDYGFTYSDEDVSEGNVDTENEYYNSKGKIEDHAEEALDGFHRVIAMEEAKGEWGFKAYKQIIKLQFRLQKYDEMLESYKQMLTYTAAAVTKNQSEKKINSLLDFMGSCPDKQLLQKFYEITLASQGSTVNERTWCKTNLELCYMWLQTKEYGLVSKTVKQLKKACENPDGTQDMKKATHLLEILSIEIQMHTELKNYKKLKELYHGALTIKSAIPHPRIMGVIRECGGKMHMREKAWQLAHTDFFEAFKSYDEAGSSRRVMCLKYLVLANMLMESSVDPFNAQEAKPYRNHPEIQVMTDLVMASQNNDINKFERVLRINRAEIDADPFIRNYIEDLMIGIRTQVLLKLIGPYTRVRIPFIADRVNNPVSDVERLLVSLILDGRIQGRIDQVNQLLILSKDADSAKYEHLDKWARTLETIQRVCLVKASQA